MALKLYTGWPTQTAYDTIANRVCFDKLQISYSHPARLSFRILQAEHTQPIAHGEFVSFFDDADATYYDLANPWFEGHVHEVNPTASNEIEYICLDPTARAEREITIMNGDHAGVAVYPRAVFNPKIENDEDYAIGLTDNATCQGILQTIFDNAQSELQGVQACPASGDAYVSTDMDDWDYEPQDKIIFEETGIASGVAYFQRLYPKFRMLFVPGNHATTGRKWRLFDVKAATQVELTLNSFPVDGMTGLRTDRWVLSKQLKPILDNRAPAVVIYGPEQINDADIKVSDGDLLEDWDLTEEGNFNSLGPTGGGIGHAGLVWQVDDADKRHMARTLKESVTVTAELVRIAGQTLLAFRTRLPTLIVTWDGSKWYNVNGINLEVNTGKVWAPYPVFRLNSTGTYLLPTDARLIYSYFAVPLTARYPSTGFAGTMNTVAGYEFEKKIYEEGLAVFYENFNVVTSSTRIAEYKKIAQQLQENIGDIGWTGGFTVISGDNDQPLDTEWLRLNRRVNFTAVDADGDPLTTGWEEIDAIVTDVEYDFQQRLTLVTLSSDLQNVEDLETLKQRLITQAVFQQGIVLSISSSDLGISGYGTLGEDYDGGSIGGGLTGYGLNIPTGLNIPGGLNIPRSLDIPGLSGDF